MSRHKTSSFIPKLKDSVRVVGVLLLSITSLTVSNSSAEVLSLSIVTEQFQLPAAESTVPATPRLDTLREAFFAEPISESRAKVSSPFGPRVHPVLSKRKHHDGIDYSAPKGTPIRATADGTVAFIGRKAGYGKVIVIEHSAGFSTLYAHQSRFSPGLKKGAEVPQGKTIGYVGSTGTATGNHLHYEVWLNNEPVDPSSASRLYAENEGLYGSTVVQLATVQAEYLRVEQNRLQ